MPRALVEGLAGGVVERAREHLRRARRARGRRAAACARRRRSAPGTAARSSAGCEVGRGDVPVEVVDRANGSSRAAAKPLAALKPTSSAPTSPGPRVAATSVTSSTLAPARANASAITASISSTWWRAAISGTTPPKRSCTSCEEITFACTVPSRADERGAGVVAAGLEREDHGRWWATGSAAGTSSRRPSSVAGVRHMISASSPLSW